MVKVFFWVLGGIAFGALKRANAKLDALKSGEISSEYFIGNLIGGSVVWGIVGLMLGLTFFFVTRRSAKNA